MACTINALCLLIANFILTSSFEVCAQQYLIENQKPNKTMPLNSAQLVDFLSTSKQKIISTNNKLEFNLSGSIKNDNKQVIKQFNKKRFFSASPSPKNSTIPRIAILLPLTGPHAKLGQAMLNAAQLALFHFADRQIELLPQDTKGTERGAFDAVTLAISDGASLILGPLFSRSVAASAPAARAAGIKIIAFSNDSSIAGDGVFTMGFLPQEQVRRVVKFAISRGFKRFAVLAPDSSYGLTIVNALRQITEENDIEVSAQVFYDPQTNNFHPVIRSLANYDQRRQKLIDTRRLLAERDDEVAKLALKRLENLQTLGDVAFDALLIADGGKVLQSIAALLPYYDIDPKKIRMLGTGHWDISRIGSEPALVGGWFAAPSPESRREFISQYEGIYNEKPPRLATLAYDATALAAIFAQSEESNELGAKQPLFQLLELSASRGFKGLDGIFRFLPEGYVERGLSIFQVGERNNKIISRSPQKFMNPSD